VFVNEMNHDGSDPGGISFGMSAKGASASRDSGTNVAAAYAIRLLASLGLNPSSDPSAPDQHPAIAWATSCLMELTGLADGPGQMCPVPLAACADGALAALASLAPEGSFDGLSGARLLSERAAIMGGTAAKLFGL